MGVVEAVMPVEQLEEFLALVDSGSAEPQSTGQRRLDGLLDVVRSGAASADAPLSERYMVHVVGDLDALAGTVGARAELLEGTPISVETLRRMTCDAPLVRHVLKGDSEPLDVGRRSSVWTTAQRRAIVVRDKGHCRFPGCWRRTADVHHIVYYGDGGETNVNNGLLLCPKHHTLVHEGGFSIEGDANTACFLDPRGCEVWPRKP
jgi:hypothetical protein